MLDFNREKLKYTPREISRNTQVLETKESDVSEVAKKLIEHADMIKEYRDRIDAVDYLIDNAEKLAGNIRFDIKDPALIKAVQSLGFDGDYIDFYVFKEAVSVLLKAYEETALIELTGVRDEY